MPLNTLQTNYIYGSYQNDLRFLLKVAENNTLRLYPNTASYLRVKTDSESRPVIGYGYDLVANRGTAVADLIAVGEVLTQEQINAIGSLTATTTGIPTALTGLVLPSELSATALLDLAISARQRYFDSFLASVVGEIGLSRERAVLESMWYQAPGGGKKNGYFRNKDYSLTNMTQALIDGNRAEVWYQIRYKSSQNVPGIINRRYAESAYFGLYENNTVTAQEAKSIYRMFGLHRQDMLDYDLKNDGIRVSATSRYGLNVPALNDPGGLGAAKDCLLADLGLINIGISANSYLATDIYLDPGRSDASAAIDPNHKSTLVGSARNDILIGEGGDDTLSGGSGDDFIIGGQGSDILKGGAGADIYIFKSGEGKDKIEDSDGLGRLIVGGKELTEASFNTYRPEDQGRKQTWKSADGTIFYVYDRKSKDLVITGSALGEGQITIEKFDIDQAAAGGYLGLKLEQKSQIELRSSGSEKAFASEGHLAQTNTSNLSEGMGKSLTCFLNAAAKLGDCLKLTLAGGDLTKFSCCKGDETVSFADGEITLQLAEGQTEISFALLNTGDVDADQTLTLSATLLPNDGGDPVSNTLTVNFDATVEASVAPTTKTIKGDIIPTDTNSAQGGIQATVDAIGNPIGTTGDYEDILSGTGDNDHILAGKLNDDVSGGAGDDSIEGGSGDDYLRGETGNDLIEGGADSDIVVGDAGNDQLYGNIKMTPEAAIAAGSTATGSGVKGDWLSGNLGEDTLIAGADNDVLAGGAGTDLLIAGAGDDNVMGDTDYVPALIKDDTWRYQLDGINQYHSSNTTYDWHYTDTPDARVFEPVYGETSPAGGAADMIYAGAGDDHVWAGAGDDNVWGEDGNDVINGEDGNDVVLGGNGNDLLSGDAKYLDDSLHGDDFLDGGAGNDSLSGQGGSDVLFGGVGNDLLIGDNDDQVVDKQGADYLDGEDGDDQLNAGGGADTLYGGDGNDKLVGDDTVTPLEALGDDYLDGEGGNDSLSGAGGSDVLVGGSGDDVLYGDSDDTPLAKIGDDFLDGGTGNDTLYGDGGADQLTGGSGDDYLVGDDFAVAAEFQGDDFLDGGEGDDTLHGTGGNDVLIGGLGADYLGGDSMDTPNAVMGDDYLNGGDGNDTLVGHGGHDTLLGGAGNDSLNGDAVGLLAVLEGNDSLDGEDGDDSLFGGGGNDSLIGGLGADYLMGDNSDTASEKMGNDVLDGGDGNDSIQGFGGNDWISGGRGTDYLDGGAGNDTYVFQLGDSPLTANNEAEVVIDAGGDDTVVIEGADTGNIVVDTTTAGSLILKYSASDYILLANGILGGIENFKINGETLTTSELIGRYSTKTVSATDSNGNYFVYGGNDNDLLFGGGKNDVLSGGDGTDTLQGGAGNDTYYISTGDTVTEAAGAGIDTVISDVTWTLGSNLENLTLTGFDDIDGTGNTLNNLLIGNSAANVLSGGVGADTMRGGSGDDTYVVNGAGDIVTENLNEGTDLVQSSVTCTLAANVENLTLTGTTAINGTGNSLNNVLIGNSAINTLTGGAGNDTYYVSTGDTVTEGAGAGTDTVISDVTWTLGSNLENLTLTGAAIIDGTGNALDNVLTGNSAANTLTGGAGNDTYYVSTGDTVTEAAGAGTDTVISDVSWTLDSNLENLTLTGTTAINGTGNTLDNVLTGNSAINILSGDTGNDTYYVSTGDTVTEAASTGTDTVISDISWMLGNNLENLTLTGTAAINGTGNSLNNLLIGNSAANTLSGGNGPDTMQGGLGNDTYVVNGAGDIVTENLNEGTDLVQSSVTCTLAANVENLTLTGTTAINGTGNSLSNVLTGNSAINTLTGGAGNDTYYVSTSDTVTEGAGAGIDAVISDVTWTLGSNLENLTLTGAAIIDGTGNALDNVLTGNSATNILTGGAGNDTYYVSTGDTVTEAAGAGTDTVISDVTWTLDSNLENLTLAGTIAINGTGNTLDNVLTGNSAINTLTGGAGNDTYVLKAAGDIVIENLNEGTDLVQSSVTCTLAANVENLTLTGTTAINGTGNSLNNFLVGNSAANTLSGGNGADTMQGGAGNDTYVVNGAGDIVTENLNEGTDLVQSSVTCTLAANVENLTLTGTTAINGTGNSLDNVLTGNSAINTLTGGAGNDTYYVSTGDTVTEAVSAGTDTVISDVTWTLGGNLENLTLTGLVDIDGTGNSLNNLLIGTSATNTLSGGGGADTMQGGAGNDTYVVDDFGDIVTENLNEGTDLVQSSVTFALAANIENLTLTGTTAINGTGNSLDNTLIGNSAVNTLAGGAGNDTYYVSTGDTVIEAASTDTDTVIADVTWTLGDNLENLSLTGLVGIDGTGNSLNNLLIGNSAANVLSGGTGLDTMQGGAGNDTYVVNGTGDIVTENLDEGTDLVQSSVTYTLAANVENLTLTGTTAINGTGNTLDNILIGNAANNTLAGAAGNDTMLGGLGNDIYYVNVATDVVTENVNQGFDSVYSSVTLTLAANAEALFMTGTAAINGTGNTLNNLVRGNTGVNTLNGGTGNDILEGGDGNDTLTDTSGSALFNGGAGTDSITGGAAAEIFLGGLDNDTYSTGAGNDIVLFNKGDGQDTFATGGTGSDTISLGGSGLTYADLVLTKSSNDLILKVGATDQITFKDWYATTPARPVANLQVIAEAIAGFTAGGSDPLKDQKVEKFNFAGLVGAFDAARAANSGLTSWALTNGLSSFQLAGSDTAALGGDLAYQYGKNGTLAGIGVTPALTTLSDAALGTTAQALTPIASLQVGSVRLS